MTSKQELYQKYVSACIAYIHAKVMYYNSECEPGFEITINDIIELILRNKNL